MSPALRLERVRRDWGDFSLEVDFDAQEGEFLSILGPSGAGKSSLLRIIAGLEAAASGRILIGGRDMAPVPPEKRSVGMVFQDLALFPHLSVAGNIAYGLRAHGLKGSALKATVKTALEGVGLSGFERRDVETLSGGERQRVALARSLAVNPRIMLLDEPLSALDAPLRKRLRVEMRSFLKERGILSILVTHDQDEAFAVSDRVLIMLEGRIVDSGSPEELRSGGNHPFTSEFIG
jgi:ABC-type Fe3+/spermidine/putrescine transport system ATPase subunit